MHELFKPNDLHWADIATNTGMYYLTTYFLIKKYQGQNGKNVIYDPAYSCFVTYFEFEIFFTEGIELLGYQRYGTVQGPRIGKERINGSILKDNDPFT